MLVIVTFVDVEILRQYIIIVVIVVVYTWPCARYHSNDTPLHCDKLSDKPP